MFQWVESMPLGPAIAVLLVVIYCRAGGTYLLGRLAYRLADRGRTHHILTSPRVESAVGRIQRWGAPFVALSFLTVGFQTAANLAAGVLHMPLRYYLPALAIGGLAWAVLYATVGLGALMVWWQIVLSNPIVGGLIAFAVIALVTVLIVKKRRRRVEEQHARDAALLVLGERGPHQSAPHPGKPAERSDPEGADTGCSGSPARDQRSWPLGSPTDR